MGHIHIKYKQFLKSKNTLCTLVQFSIILNVQKMFEQNILGRWFACEKAAFLWALCSIFLWASNALGKKKSLVVYFLTNARQMWGNWKERGCDIYAYVPAAKSNILLKKLANISYYDHQGLQATNTLGPFYNDLHFTFMHLANKKATYTFFFS